MKPETLLRLYPRAWRDRYGEEFLEACGTGPLGPQHVIDIIGGAIDARMSPQGHVAEASRVAGGSMSSVVAKLKCRSNANYTTRDGLMSAAFLVVSSFVIMGAAMACRAAGWTFADHFLKSFAFPASLILSSHFTFLKGQSATTKWVISAGTLAILALISGLAAAIGTR